MRQQYKNPPIDEAVVEFQFTPTQEWDLTIPGKLHEHSEIKDNYPGKPRTRKLMEAAFRSEPNQLPNIAVRDSVHRIEFVDEERKHVISLGPDVLSISKLRPYEGWQSFRPRILSALGAYQDVASPEGLSRIGVRYVNRIVPKEQEINIEAYLKCAHLSTSELPDKVGGFLSRFEYVYDDESKLTITQASVTSQEGELAFLVDLDVVWEGSGSLDLDDTIKKVEDLHEREGVAFEAIITSSARELFNAD